MLLELAGWEARTTRRRFSSPIHVQLFLSGFQDGRLYVEPVLKFLENPPGGGSFACCLRWLGSYSSRWECSILAALAAAKISRHRTSRNFRTRSELRHAMRLSAAL